jgi:FkbH-like protein
MKKLLNQIESEFLQYKMSDYFSTLAQLRKQTLSSLKSIKVAILRSYSAESLETILSVQFILRGYNPVFFWGDYNQYAQEILDEESPLYQFKPDFALLLVRHEELLPEFSKNYVCMEKNRWLVEIKTVATHYSTLIKKLSERTNASILIQNFSFIPEAYLGIYDVQQPINQDYLISQLNFEVTSALASNPTVYFWNFNKWIIKFGWKNLYDPKMDYFAHNPFTSSAYIEMGHDLMRYIGSILGQQKKCIVLDLDNTLWGGIIGEDGIAGIQLSNEYPGNCFLSFQESLVRLTHRGIVLALNSKNNEADVNEVFNKHPDIAIKKNDIVAERVNWQDKVTNLNELAQELNIGLDSMIFIDDNPAECEFVRNQLPEVSVVQVPSKPYLIPQLINILPRIENIRLTEEDRKKSIVYKSQAERSALEKIAVNLTDFLNALEMKIKMIPCDEFSLPRIAQLTQKTNQFNLTTKRYTEADLIKMISSSQYKIFSISARDRFGDHGTIGVFIINIIDFVCEIDTFLLSCRVISRTIEQSMLAFIEEIAQKNNCQNIIGRYIPTPKNKQVKDFYSNFGFDRLDDETYCLKLTEMKKISYSQHINIVN